MTKLELENALEVQKRENIRLNNLVTELEIELSGIREEKYQEISETNEYQILLKQIKEIKDISNHYKALFEHEKKKNEGLIDLLEETKTKRAGRKPNPSELERKVFHLGELLESGKNRPLVL